MLQEIYKMVDKLIIDLSSRHYHDFSHKIQDAKISGSMGSEILGNIFQVLEENKNIIKNDNNLQSDILQLMKKIEKSFK